VYCLVTITNTSIDLQEYKNDENVNSTRGSNKTDSATNENNTEETALSEAHQQETESTKFIQVQFQYDGKDKIATIFASSIFDSPGICGKDAKTAHVIYYSFVVLPAYQAFQLIVYIKHFWHR